MYFPSPTVSLASGIYCFAVIDLGIKNFGAEAFPAFIRRQDLNLAVFVFNFDLADHAHVIRKIVGRAVVAKAADRPALAADDLDAIFSVL